MAKEELSEARVEYDENQLIYSKNENLSVLKNGVVTYSRHEFTVVRAKHRNELAPAYKRYV